MKKLTYSRMAAARLRANKREYRSLVLGIILSIFLISTLVLSVNGIYQAELQKRYDKVGYLDVVILDNATATEEDIRSFDEFDRFGHAYISGIVTDRNVYVGYYDEVGFSLMNLKPVEGRLPKAAGEIAIEASAMDVLEVSWRIGETVELDITPVDGTPEKRSFTLVGILPERSVYLSVSDKGGLNQFPAILTSPEEPAFPVGRLGIHHLMGLAKHATLAQALETIWDKIQSSNGNWSILTDFYGLSISGEQQQTYGLGSAIDVDREMFGIITIAAVLGGSLILSCGVGISGAMEGVLSKRREEIGVLRALGATRRQIRQMFGRENLMLALIVSPLSILISMIAVWILSLLLPGSIKFAVNLWLILPIVLLSIVMILISGYLPLVRSSKLMPMSVIRDTAMLRRSKSVKSKKEFSATKLIASRQVRFNPTRQIGASLLVGLMLLCSGLLAGFIVDYASISIGDKAGFRVDSGASWFYDGHIGFVGNPSMDKRSISQIRSLPHVRSIDIDRHMTVSVLLDHVPLYAALDDQYGMLDDAQFDAAMSYKECDRAFWEERREEDREQYLQFLKDYQIAGEAYRTVIATVELNAKNLTALKPYIESGRINVDAINAGTEVLVIAPEVWIKPSESGYGYLQWYSEDAAKNDPRGDGAFLAAYNDSFAVGQSVPLMQLYQTEPEGTVYRVDTDVAVGAILTSVGDLTGGLMNDVMIITTEQGLENMGLLTEGLYQIEVYLDGQLSLAEEEILERQLNAIARRFDGYTVTNHVEFYRNVAAQNRQQIILFAAIAIVFFSVSVGMIVSSTTRQLNSEGRTIGMLRAVGADEKAILECYSGQLNASIAGGMGISLGLYFVFLIIYFISMIESGFSPMSEIQVLLMMAAAICVMGVLCLAVCKFLLRFRVREIISKSIIDNIREL